MMKNYPIEKLKNDLAEILTPERYQHSLAVMDTARHLAEVYQFSPVYDAEIAGLLHDIAKDMSDLELMAAAERYGITVSEVERAAPGLLHGPVGAKIAAERYPGLSEEIYSAIRHHTTGRPGMGDLEKIVFLADMIEPGRTYPDLDIYRSWIGIDLDLFCAKMLDEILLSLVRRNKPIDPTGVVTRNELYLKIRRTKK